MKTSHAVLLCAVLIAGAAAAGSRLRSTRQPVFEYRMDNADLLFETTQGTKNVHDLVRYDPRTGRAWFFAGAQGRGVWVPIADPPPVEYWLGPTNGAR